MRAVLCFFVCLIVGTFSYSDDSFSHYYSGTLVKDHKKDRPLQRVLEELDIPQEDVSALTKYQTSECQWGWLLFVPYPKGCLHEVHYLVGTNRKIDKLEEAGFSPIEHLQLAIRLTRISDINGWGTGVNGERRRSYTLDPQWRSKGIAEAIAMIRALRENPFETIERHWPKAIAWVFQKKGVAGSLLTERGFRPMIVFSALVGDKLVEGQKQMYQWIHQSSSYFPVTGEDGHYSFLPDSESDCPSRLSDS